MLMPQRDSPFVVAPWIEVWSLRRWLRDAYAVSILEDNGLSIDLLLRNFLDSLQPNAGRSTIRLGYMVAINVYDLFMKDDSGKWQFDSGAMKFFTDLFLGVNRPVVINLRANHFVGEGPLVTELMEHEDSYARLNDGTAVREIYYTNAVFAPTFALDPGIPFNSYRFGGFARAAALLADFDREHPGIIHAITLAGEVHHFLPELANPKVAGLFEGAQMTDYSAASIRDFSRWLESRYGGLRQLNDRFGTLFRRWDDVEPPRWDLRHGRSEPQWMHTDSYANGVLPIFGWAASPVDGTLHVYLNGTHIGEAEYGLSRLDVYEALPWLQDSDIGFRFDLDYRDMATGPHIIHVVLQKNDGRRFLAGRRFLGVGAREADIPHDSRMRGLDDLPDCIDERGRFAWVDHPPIRLPLLFNAYAAEWQEFREYQVNALLLKFAEIAVQSGIAPGKLYSHQIMPQFEGTWNRVAFGVSSKFPASHLFSPGIDLYGGASVYRGLGRFLDGARYAVPELHPRMGRLSSRDVFLRALRYHRDLGADFVCPYFMALREPEGRGNTADPSSMLDALLIHPLNPAFGSLFFHTALMEFLNQEQAEPVSLS